MNVPSYEFFAFAAAVIILINVSNAPAWRMAILLVANIAFVLSFTRNAAQLAPFAGLLVVGFAATTILATRKNRTLFAAFVVVLFVAFCWLKRYAFIPSTLLLPYVYFTVGMSYVFFRIMHLVIDAYQDALPGRVGAVAFTNYTLNFTSFVSGPIQYYRDYVRTESERPEPLDRAAVGAALARIATGFFKVTVLSALLLFAQQRSTTLLFGAAGPADRMLFALLAIGLFPLYLYFNFSGYTDVVIGIARLLRLVLPENFNKPFAARGYIEFWGRWHMTLSDWLKTYVYSPLLLSLMRRYPSRNVEPYLGVFAYFVTFFLVGAWHGQTVMFLIFGVLQGAGVSMNKLYQIQMIKALGRAGYRGLCANPAYDALSRALTLAYFAVSLLAFWATRPQLERLASTLGGAGEMLGAVVLVLAAAMGIAFIRMCASRFDGLQFVGTSPIVRRYATAALYTAMVVATISVTVVLNAPAPRIVYRAF